MYRRASSSSTAECWSGSLLYTFESEPPPQSPSPHWCGGRCIRLAGGLERCGPLIGAANACVSTACWLMRRFHVCFTER